MSNARVDLAGKYERTSGPKRVLWPICHTAPWTKSPNFEVLLYLDKFPSSFCRELHRPPFCFPTCSVVVARLNVGSKGMHRHEQ